MFSTVPNEILLPPDDYIKMKVIETENNVNFGHYEPPYYDHPDFNPYFGYVAGSFFLFTCVNYATRLFTPFKLSLKRGESEFQAKWKWRNTLTSFIHSTLTGFWSIMIFVADPSFADDMINGYSKSGHLLISISMGYFAYDVFDMGLYTWHKRSTKEMLLHHIVVFSCFGIAAHTQFYIPYAVISLIIEINSMCLHARALLLLTGWSKQSSLFRLIAFLNLVTYVFFRICVLGWMTRWLTLHRDDLPLVIFTIASVGLATIVAINILNFYRVLMSDFLKVVYEGAIAEHAAPRKTKVSESNDEDTSSEEIFANGSTDKMTTLAATENLVEKIRDAAYLKTSLPFNEGTNGFHPISRDVNKIMNSFFSNDVMEDFEMVEEEENSNDNVTRKRVQQVSEDTVEHIPSSGGCESIPSDSKKDN